ncbi:aspartate aminotransferase family protein [Vallitalea pronyensis]|uniref:Acetylornithine aminotransferase n=1 Tax=Vallitalea pronyensis TaxID=1348613 RepID=A0A8J8SHZ0_9FIRM|nr:aspartate aminotransferase family protein [Vallitalea pronyensis]QUI23924.1 aspartate aminotransferase family protein [Vallitalea pronyensis]
MLSVMDRGKEVFMNTYAQFPIVLEKGDGVYVYDQEGNKYLDFVAGIAVNGLGYNHAGLQKALKDQVDKLTHCSNLYWNEPAVEAAELLVKLSGLDKIFFCNSGAEAVEGAMKLARKYAGKYLGPDKVEIIAMNNSFHGRTYGAVTATGQLKYQKGLSPLLPGIKHCEYNDIESLQEAMNDKTCAVLIEPIQGEGGIRPAEKDYLQEVSKLCKKNNVLLMLDEVQCGVGRTGYMFAYQRYGIEPDIVALAKGLGGGVPIGAIMASKKVAEGFSPGDHASTYGGNALVCAGAKVVLEVVGQETLLEQVRKKGTYLKAQLTNLQEKFNDIIEVRGHGLMLGMEMNKPVKEIILGCMAKGLLLVGSGEKIIRFVPPLIVEEKEIDFMVTILEEVMSEIG